MKSKEKAKRIPASDIPEVEEALALKNELDTLRVDYPEVFMKYTDLVERYNAAIEAAEKIVRAKEVSCGPFDNYSVRVTYDPQKMYDELGEELFLECGGKSKTVVVLEVDDKAVEAAIAKKLIPEESVDEFMKIQRNYHAPKKITMA